MRNKYIYFLVLFWAMYQNAAGQNFAEDFKAINKAYMTGDMSFNLRYDYYNEAKSTKPSYFYTGVVKLKGSLVYYKMNGVEFSYDSIYSCMIDHENKTIMVDTVRQKSNMLARVNLIDSLTNAYKSITFANIDANTAKYTVYSLLPGISHCEITYNKTNKLLQKITIYFLDNRDGAKADAIRNKLVISYNNINTNANNSLAIYRAQRVLSIKGRKVSPLPLYSKYDVINNMQ